MYTKCTSIVMIVVCLWFDGFVVGMAEQSYSFTDQVQLLQWHNQHYSHGGGILKYLQGETYYMDSCRHIYKEETCEHIIHMI